MYKPSLDPLTAGNPSQKHFDLGGAWRNLRSEHFLPYIDVKWPLWNGKNGCAVPSSVLPLTTISPGNPLGDAAKGEHASSCKPGRAVF